MNVKDLAKEAELFMNSLLPIFELMDREPANNLNNLLMIDVAKIALICGYADSNFDSNERLATYFFLGAITATIMSEDREGIISSWYLWDILSDSTKNHTIYAVDNLFEEAKKQGLNMLITPKLLRESQLTSLFDKVASTLYRATQVIVKADGTIKKEEEEALKKVYNLIYGQPTEYIQTSKSNKATAIFNADQYPQETLEEVMGQLNALIGMENIKQEVFTLTNYLKVQKERIERRMMKTPISLHAVFYGPPGTGKTTVARLLGNIYKNLGFLSKGHIVETDRAGLVAGYVGQTLLKVDEVISSALDGVLFIDEAYSLKPENTPSDFGQEVIDILLKRMEDYRERLVVIVAGHTDEMQRFIESKPGLKSRFNRYLYFDHFKPEELLAIFEKFCKDGHFKLAPGALDRILSTFEVLYTKRGRTFGNGRLARNIFEKVVERQANRIVSIAPLTDQILTTITEEDIPPEHHFSA